MNIQFSFWKKSVIVIAGLLLMACSVDKEVRQAKDTVTANMATLEKTMPKADESANRVHIVYHDDAYFGSKKIAVSSEKFLPSVFSKPVWFVSSTEGPITLPTLAEMITKYTGIRVDVNQDIFQNTTVSQGATASPANPQRNANSSPESLRVIPLNFKGSFADYLNLVCAKVSISWDYDAGIIHFFRYKSKSFEIKGVLSSVDENSSFASNGTIGTGSGTSTSNASVKSDLRTTLKYEYFKDLTAQIKSRLSSGAQVVPNLASNTIVVTATPSQLREIGLFVDDMNRRSSRVVYFDLKLYRLSDTNNDQSGLNWSGLLTNSTYRLIGTPGANLVTDTGGVGVYRLASNAAAAAAVPSFTAPGYTGDGFSGAQGSGLLLQAVNQMTGLSEEWFDNGYTMNNMPIPFTNSTTLEYVAEAGTTSSTTATTTTVTQQEYSFGVDIELTPHIYDNNSMMLELQFDVTDSVPFTITNVGGTQVKSKTVPRRASRQMLMVRPGEQIVLAKIAHNMGSGNNNTGITELSSNANRTKDSMLLVITPVLWTASDAR